MKKSGKSFVCEVFMGQARKQHWEVPSLPHSELLHSSIWWLFLVVSLITSGMNYSPEMEGALVRLEDRILTLILTWSSWGIVAMKSLCPGKVVHTFNSRRLRQADLWVQGQPGTKQISDPGTSGPHLVLEACMRVLEEERAHPSLPACTYLPAHLSAPTSSGFQLIQKARWNTQLRGLSNY